MEFKKFTPPDGLSAYIQYFWTARGENATYWRILFADCRTKLFISRQGSIRHHFNIDLMELTAKNNITRLSQKIDDIIIRESNSLIVGPQMDYSMLSCSGELDIVGVVFTEVGGHFFIPGDASEYANSTVSVSETTSIFLKDMCDVIRRMSRTDDCIATLGSVFLSRAKMSHRDAFDVSVISNVMACYDTAKEIGEIASDNCVSERQVNRLLRKYVGLSISKVFAIKRFLTALDDMINVPAERLCQIALSGLFYDKSHMVKNFRRFCGQTPGKIRLKLKSSCNDDNRVFFYDDDANVVYFVY